MDLYIAGHIIEDREEDPGPVWDILGVFDSEFKAVASCFDEDCFVGPITLNQFYSTEIVEWEGAYFPYEEK